jgi:amidase
VDYLSRPMDAADLVFAGPARQAELVASGEVSPRELVDACLERIAKLDRTLNAFRIVLGDEARAEADALDGADREGKPLFGVPVAIKDDQDVTGQATAFGTSLLFPPATADSEIVRRLRAAGAIVVGKTNVPELTIWPWTESAAFGVTRNPWNPERITGGSSGGSAAAVASGMVGLATGSDGLGSIRIPAGCCGLVGLKPQKDRVSLAPKTPEKGAWHGLAHYGVLTRSARDTALALDVIADRPPPEPFASVAGRAPLRLRIGLSFKLPPLVRARIDPAVRSAVEGVAETLRGMGHTVIERDPPLEAGPMFRGVARWFRGVRDDARATGAPRRLERKTRVHSRIGAVTPAARVARSLEEEPGYAERVSRVFDDVDVLLTPLTTTAPFEVGRFRDRGWLAAYNGSSSFVPWPGTWNIIGHPACSVPAGWDADGLPLAAQLVGRPDDEGTVLSLAAQLEAERKWTDRRPPIS